MKTAFLLLTPIIIGIFAAAFRSLVIEPSRDFSHIAMLAFQYSTITYAIAIVFGVPAYLLIRRAGLRAAWHAVLIGAVLGAISGMLVPTVLGEARAKYFFSGLYPYAIEYAMFGALSAFIVWWILVRPTKPNTNH